VKTESGLLPDFHIHRSQGLLCAASHFTGFWVLSIVLNVVHAILYACCHARELTRIIGILLNFAFPHLKIAKFSRQQAQSTGAQDEK
jgi:nicotinamide riboside transporter PnuC